jgi:hypothetical protein
MPCRGALYFHVADATMVARLLHRAKTSGRVDDNEETIKKRLKTFNEQTTPVVEHYKKQGKLTQVSNIYISLFPSKHTNTCFINVRGCETLASLNTLVLLCKCVR